jgi:hypothetical protein
MQPRGSVASSSSRTLDIASASAGALPSRFVVRAMGSNAWRATAHSSCLFMARGDLRASPSQPAWNAADVGGVKGQATSTRDTCRGMAAGTTLACTRSPPAAHGKRAPRWDATMPLTEHLGATHPLLCGQRNPGGSQQLQRQAHSERHRRLPVPRLDSLAAAKLGQPLPPRDLHTTTYAPPRPLVCTVLLTWLRSAARASPPAGATCRTPADAQTDSYGRGAGGGRHAPRSDVTDISNTRLGPFRA